MADRSEKLLRFTTDVAVANRFPYKMGFVRFGEPRVVLAPGQPGTWDDYGVRDCCILTDENGLLSRESDGALVMYYTGASSPDGMRQSIGRAVSKDEGATWHREPSEPVLAPRAGHWDSMMATTPWAVRLNDGRVRLYYRGLTKFLADESCGLAESDDGIVFERDEAPLFDRRQFPGMPQDGPVAIGVFNIVRMMNGDWLLSWEANATEADGKACIFAATSKDGRNFIPLKGGHPMFTPAQVTSFPASRVANPRITVLPEPGQYLLGYNAYDENGNWSASFAVSSDLATWEDHPGGPLISPTFEPADDPFSGRIEGPVLVKEDLISGDDAPLRCFVMAIPARGPSMCGGVIGAVTGRRNSDAPSLNFRSVSASVSDIRVQRAGDQGQEVVLQRGEESAYPTRAHFTCDPEGGKLSMSFVLEDQNSWSDIVLSPEAALNPMPPAVVVRIREQRIYTRLVPVSPEPALRIRYKILKAVGLYKPHNRDDDWYDVGAIETKKATVLEVSVSDGVLLVRLPNGVRRFAKNEKLWEKVRDIGIVVHQGKLTISKLSFVSGEAAV